jgi:hypothetical protein
MSTAMSTEANLPVEELAVRFRGEMIPLTNTFSYFSTIPLAEEDVKQYLQEPIAALSPTLGNALGKVGVVLVPYLEKGNGRTPDTVHFEPPAEGRQAWFSRAAADDMAVLVFATRGIDVADYHYHFYNALAGVVADRWSGESQERYFRLLREELGSEVHGEVDEKSWHLKQALLRRQANTRRETKLFREYARQSFEDTLTLYLHGICCDIDVETGPRQMPSRYLRRRLELLAGLYPPPEGYAVFPEQARRR